MKPSKSIRTTALTCAVGVIVIATLIGFHWEDLLTRYHLHRLETASDYLSDICQMDRPNIAAVRALEIFLRTEEGMEKVFGCYLNVVKTGFILRGIHNNDFHNALVYPPEENFISYAYEETIESRSSDDRSFASLYRINKFTSFILGRAFVSEDFPQRKFTFITKSEIPPSFDFARQVLSQDTVLLLIEAGQSRLED